MEVKGREGTTRSEEYCNFLRLLLLFCVSFLVTVVVDVVLLYGSQWHKVATVWKMLLLRGLLVLFCVLFLLLLLFMLLCLCLWDYGSQGQLGAPEGPEKCCSLEGWCCYFVLFFLLFLSLMLLCLCLWDYGSQGHRGAPQGLRNGDDAPCCQPTHNLGDSTPTNKQTNNEGKGHFFLGVKRALKL